MGTVTDERPGYALPLLLLGGFRLVIDELHRELAEHGHPEARPVHGFALQALGVDGATVSELGRRLGVSKQAAAKTAAGLERLGYVKRLGDPADRRMQRLHLTARGAELLALSADLSARVRSGWCNELGAAQLHALEGSLSSMLDGTNLATRMDLPGWLGG
jgi:DNA-binding MarR family transcriptional regulator